MNKPLFELGQIVATPGALSLLEDAGVPHSTLLTRHIHGDWGDLDQHDKDENYFSMTCGFRILSAYNVPGGRVWIITEADRSSTTILLPEEY